MSGIIPNKTQSLSDNGYTEITIPDSPLNDAFSRIRVSNPIQLFSVQCQYNNAPITMESGATGTGVVPAHNADTRMVKLSCTAGSGTSFMQSYQYVPYQAGKSQLVLMTGVFDTAVAGAVVDFGYFDANNGLFFRQNGTSGFEIVRRTRTSGSVVDNVIVRNDWDDPVNGTGPSGLNIDLTKAAIFVIDFQYLGMGRNRFYIDYNGQLILLHEIMNAFVLTVPYMQSGTLPIQMLITVASTASTKDCYFKCAAVNTEGGAAAYEDFAFGMSTPEATVTAASGSRTHLLSVRPKTTFNSITNREFLLVDDVDILVTGTNPVIWELCVGQALTAPTYADINTNYSGFEYAAAQTLSGSPGIVIASGYIASGAQVKGTLSKAIASRYPITLDRAGAVRDMGTLTLLVTGIGGTSATRAKINFREIR